MPDNSSGLYVVVGLVIIGLFAIIIVRELKQRTKIVEVVRDERGYICEVVERVM